MKIKTLKLLSISLLLTGMMTMLQGCGVTESMPTELTFRPQTSEDGLIFGSITFPDEKAKFNGYFLILDCKSTDKKTANKNSTQIRFSPEQIIRMRHQGQLDHGLTYLFTLKRPAGDYEISGIRLFSNYGFATGDSYVKGFSLPIKVNKGEIMYVGNLAFNEKGGKSNEELLSYHNNFEKDLKGMKEAQPYVYWDGSKNDLTRNISFYKMVN